MKVTVYSEAQLELVLDGKIVRFAGGEDTLPYADHRVFFVADGIGGCSSTRHRQFNKDLFDPDKQFEVLFDGVLDEEVDQDTRAYLNKCFADFVGNKDYFDDQLAARRKSSFYGARILSTLLLHKLRSDKELHIYDGGIFDGYSRCRSTADKKQYLQNWADKLGDYLHEKLMAVAEKAGFAKDKSTKSNIVMFGTTLCFTIVRENPDKGNVEALYFVAGDSRPYAMAKYGGRWGMFQTVADCEEADGSMNSCVCAEERIPIRFQCAYRQFKTPCVLFNASDGCFDSGAFISQLTYEQIIYDALRGSDSLSGVSKELKAFFSQYGRHDDCSTMAMRFFGFEDYNAIKAWAEERWVELSKRYLEEDSELLCHDYETELAECRADIVDAVNALLPDAMADAGMRGYAEAMVRGTGSREYAAAVKKKETAGQKMAEHKGAITEILRRNLFSAVIPAGKMPSEEWQKGLELQKKIYDDRRSLQTKALDVRKAVKDMVANMKEICESLDGIAKWEVTDRVKCSNKDESVNKHFDKLIVSMEKSQSDYPGLASEISKALHDLEKQVRTYLELERKEADRRKKNSAVVDANVNGLLNSEIHVEDLSLLPDDARQMTKELENYRKEQATLNEAQAKIDELIEAYITANLRVLIDAVYTKRLKAKVGKELSDAVESALQPRREQEEKLDTNCARQVKLLAEYDEVYYSVINRNRRADGNADDDEGGAEDADADPES